MTVDGRLARRTISDRRLLVASLVAGGAALVVPVALIGVVGLLVWVSLRLMRKRTRSVLLPAAAIVVLASSLIAAIALAIVAGTTESADPSGVTLIPD